MFTNFSCYHKRIFSFRLFSLFSKLTEHVIPRNITSYLAGVTAVELQCHQQIMIVVYWIQPTNTHFYKIKSYIAQIIDALDDISLNGIEFS